MSDPFASAPDRPSPAAAPALSAAAAVAAIEAHPEAIGTPAQPASAPDNPFATPPAPVEEELPPGMGRGRFLGPERAFWRLLSRGAVLLAITLGIYRFWLATDTRRFLWNNTEIAGDGLEYTGTARELLIGFLIAVALLVPINVLLFLGAFVKGTIGQLSGLIAIMVLAVFGQFAVYRARRYRLTRTIYRGLRFRQTGSAWRYAVCALFWWGMIAITLGLAYPFAQASLERFKVGNTYYGDLRGRFEGSGFGLFFRGLLMWLLVMVPLIAGLVAGIGALDWTALGQAIQNSDSNATKWIDDAQIGSAVAFAVLGISWAIIAAAGLYPVFQAMVMRWWISGLRFGTLTATSRLRIGSVYGLYLRFVWYALLAGIALGLFALAVFLVIGGTQAAIGKGTATEVLTVALSIGTYVIAALAYSTIYQATVKLRLWKLGFDTLQLSGIETLDGVKAAGEASSALGEGLADALHVGGI
jgi:uncharacterized membrane protein YjgN (DUF898 family)